MDMPKRIEILSYSVCNVSDPAISKISVCNLFIIFQISMYRGIGWREEMVCVSLTIAVWWFV